MGISFSIKVVRKAFDRSGGVCECFENDQKCVNKLIWNRKGFNGSGGWEVYPMDLNGSPSLGNCQIFCTTCFKLQKKKREIDNKNVMQD